MPLGNCVKVLLHCCIIFMILDVASPVTAAMFDVRPIVFADRSRVSENKPLWRYGDAGAVRLEPFRLERPEVLLVHIDLRRRNDDPQAQDQQSPAEDPGREDAELGSTTKWSGEIVIYQNLSYLKTIDRDVVGSWTLAATELLNVGLRKFLIENPRTGTSRQRLTVLLAVAGLSYLLETPIAGSSHEYGHFAGDSIAGMNEPEFVSLRDRHDRLRANPIVAFITMFRQNVLFSVHYAAGQSEREVDEFFSDPALSKHWQAFFLLSAAGGLNQDQYNVELLSERMLDGKGHVLLGIGYFGSVFNTMGYPLDAFGDVVVYKNFLRARGIRVGEDTIKWYSQVPKLLSNSNIALTLGVIRFVRFGEIRIIPLKVEFGEVDIYWPEFRSYLTLYGPTIQNDQRFDIGGDAYRFIHEMSLGRGGSEVGIVYRTDFGSRSQVEVEVRKNLESGGTWFELAPTLDLGEYSVGFQVFGGRGYTFRRDVMGHSLSAIARSEYGVKAFARYAFDY